MTKKIKSALISVFHKDGLEPILENLAKQGVAVYSTGGTYKFIEAQGHSVNRVEDLTGYPSILGGRVKTLHPKVFGGILAKREADHLGQLEQYDIPTIDLVIVDLYPFEQTLKETSDEATLIEKIDIGGIALIRAAAKNFGDVVIVSSKGQYDRLNQLLVNGGESTLEERKEFAAEAFQRSSSYDQAIQEWMFGDTMSTSMRYGENPHQTAHFKGKMSDTFQKLNGKALSYNNLVDVDSAIDLMSEFQDQSPTFAVIKHTNACGLAQRATVLEAWSAALAADPVSAFGGILICNAPIDLATAEEIQGLFYEVLIAPAFDADALALLKKKSKRILLQLEHWPNHDKMVKTCLTGLLVQDRDIKKQLAEDLTVATEKTPSHDQIEDLLFASISVKHLKSNGISLVKNGQLLSMGCGQTSRVDALRQAIAKAAHFNFDLNGAVMASDAFFPFPDCAEIAHEAGIVSIIQPGGSIKDKLTIDFCNHAGMSMVMTGVRHFKH